MSVQRLNEQYSTEARVSRDHFFTESQEWDESSLQRTFIPFLMSVQLPARAAIGALHLIAVGTIDGFIPSGQERHLGLIATTGTGHVIHLARLTCSTAIATAPAIASTPGLFARGPAGRTARRRICQTSACKKLLLTGGEGKLLTTVATIQNLILKSHRLSLFQGRSPLNSVYRAQEDYRLL